MTSERAWKTRHFALPKAAPAQSYGKCGLAEFAPGLGWAGWKKGKGYGSTQETVAGAGFIRLCQRT